MSKKRKIEIHNSEELAQIDEELDCALDKLDTANFTVGGLLEELEAANREASAEEMGGPESKDTADSKGEESSADTTS